jgi:hypothetical protein
VPTWPDSFYIMMQCLGSDRGAGSNYPLRGCKDTSYEGGSHVPVFVFSPLLGHKIGTAGGQYTKLFHVTDWLPTLISGMLGRIDLVPATVPKSKAFFSDTVSTNTTTTTISVGNSSTIDGINQWDTLMYTIDQNSAKHAVKLASQSAANYNAITVASKATSAPRTSFVYNIDPISGISAVRREQWKLIVNESTSTGWYNSVSFGTKVRFAVFFVELCHLCFSMLLVEHFVSTSYIVIPSRILILPFLFKQICTASLTNNTNSIQLYDIDNDPEERNEVSAQHLNIVATLYEEIQTYIR